MLFRMSVFIFFTFGASTQALACSWPNHEIKASEFVKGKTIFWGRALETKQASAPSHNLVVDVVKPLHGKTKKRVRLLVDNSTSCAHEFKINEVELYILRKWEDNRLYTDQAIMHRASHAAIIAFLEEGLDSLTKGQPGIELFTSYGEKEEIDDKDFRKIQNIYKRERNAAIKIKPKKAWWKFWKK